MSNSVIIPVDLTVVLEEIPDDTGTPADESVFIGYQIYRVVNNQWVQILSR